MKENENKDLIERFHQLWDAFPGPVRLIDQNHRILAANVEAISKGFLEGLCCARVGEPCSHKGCKSKEMLRSGQSQLDCPEVGRVRGWVPVQGHKDVYVHFTLMLPEEQER